MSELFGSRAAEIFEAETHMQLEFDKFCRETEGGVPVWPCLPLNMKFD